MRVRCTGILVFLATALLAGCVERAPSARPEDSTRRTGRDSARHTVADTLPAGRYQLRFHTRGVPDLFISLPAGYTIKDQGHEGADDLMMIAVDDPSLRSASAVSPGYVRLRTVQRDSLAQIALPVARPDSADIIIAGRAVRWMRASEIDGSEMFRYARIESPDFFSALSPELAKSAPMLIVEVAGASEQRVAGLTSAVESIRFVP